MYSKAKAGGHPIHPMLVAFPITFYTTTLFAFVIYQFFNRGVFWYHLGYFCTFAGIIMALFAAVPGFIDWAFGIPKDTAAKTRGLLHMGLNVSALILFVVTAFELFGTWNNVPENVAGPLALSFTGVLLTMVAGYHGWELVAKHKVGVDLTPAQERLEPTQEMGHEKHDFTNRPQPH